MSKHIETRKALIDIAEVQTFNAILDRSTLSEEDKYIMKQHYLHNKNFALIGDELGYAEITIIKRHSKILKKISKLLGGNSP